MSKGGGDFNVGSLPSYTPSVSNRGLRRGRRARRESKIVNLAARRSGADSNCYVLLSCGRPFDRVRRASSEDSSRPSLARLSSRSISHLSYSTCVHALARTSLFFASGVADRSSPTGSINAFGESVGTTMPISVRHSSADCVCVESL